MKKKYLKPQTTLIPIEGSVLLAGSGGNETGTAGNKNQTVYNGNDGTTRLAKGDNLWDDESSGEDMWNDNPW